MPKWLSCCNERVDWITLIKIYPAVKPVALFDKHVHMLHYCDKLEYRIYKNTSRAFYFSVLISWFNRHSRLLLEDDSSTAGFALIIAAER